MAGWPKLNARSCPALLGGGRPASIPWPPGAAITSARSSGPRVSGYSGPDLPAGVGASTAPARSPLPIRRPRVRGPGRGGLPAERARTAFRHASEGIALCRQFAYLPPLAAGLATLAWIQQASGDPAGAREAIGEAVQAAPGPAGLLNPVPAQHTRLLLAQGNLTEAARWTKECGLDADDEPDYSREREHLVLARVLLAQGEAERALALLGRLHEAAAAQDRAGSLIEIGALRALALAARGEESPGGCPGRDARYRLPAGLCPHVRRQGPPMAALLARLIAVQRTGQAAAGVPLGYLARLQRAFGARAPAPGSGREPSRYRHRRPADQPRAGGAGDAGAGRSNQSIACELFVTVDTVKKHVGHVLGKLGAGNRTEAVARARELSLIPYRPSRQTLRRAALGGLARGPGARTNCLVQLISSAAPPRQLGFEESTWTVG